MYLLINKLNKLFCGMSVLFAAAALALTAARDVRAGVVLGLVVVLVFVLARVAGLMRQPKVLGRLRRRGRVARALREGLPRFEQRLDADGLDMDGAWQALVDLCREAGCSHVAWRTRGHTRPDRRSGGAGVPHHGHRGLELRGLHRAGLRHPRAQAEARPRAGAAAQPPGHSAATAATKAKSSTIPPELYALSKQFLRRNGIDIVRFRPAPGQGGTDLDDQTWLTAQRRARGELPRDPDQIDQADQPDQAHQLNRTDHPTPDPEKAPDRRRQEG